MDHALFAERFHTHAPRVFAICVRLLGDRERATDAAQDVFVRAWERADQFLEGSNYGAWIARIATTVSLNALRADNARVQRGLSLLATEPAARTAPPGLRLDIECGIAQLAPATRAVFTLHDIEGFTTDEIAEHVGITPATVRVHIHRARKALRAHLSR